MRPYSSGLLHRVLSVRILYYKYLWTVAAGKIKGNVSAAVFLAVKFLGPFNDHVPVWETGKSEMLGWQNGRGARDPEIRSPTSRPVIYIQIFVAYWESMSELLLSSGW